MTPIDSTAAHHAVTEPLYDELERRYGPLLGGQDLARVLGYRSLDSLRQAAHRGQLPIPVFTVEHRRGKFALTRDAAAWLTERRQSGARDRHELASSEPSGGGSAM